MLLKSKQLGVAFSWLQLGHLLLQQDTKRSSVSSESVLPRGARCRSAFLVIMLTSVVWLKGQLSHFSALKSQCTSLFVINNIWRAVWDYDSILFLLKYWPIVLVSFVGFFFLTLYHFY